MRIGILADTHDELERTQRAVEILRAEGAEVLVHCGDLSTAPIVAACAVLPCYFVFGNHDADNVPALKRAAADHGVTCLGWGGAFEVAGRKIGVVHGHLTMDLRRVMQEGPDYLLSGHAHYAVDAMEGPVRRINPGALYRADEFTVALLDVADNSLQFLKLTP